MNPFRIVIVGGGITGLTAAYRLQAHAHRTGAPFEVHLFERDATPGGKLRTERIGGFLIEAGPDIFLARKPAALDLCRDLGLADRLRPTRPEHRRSYLRHGDRLIPLPEGLSGLVPTRLRPLLASPLLSLCGKLRLGLDLVLPPRRNTDDETIAAFISRRLGHEAYERLVDPLLGGIYGGGGDMLSLQATFPQLRTLERRHGSLIRGLLREASSTASGPAFLSFDEGMGTLPHALTAALTNVRIVTGQAVDSVEPAGQGYRVRAGQTILKADTVLLTTPAYVSARLVASFAPDLAGELASIPYGSTITLSVAFRREDVPHPLDGYGYIVPRREASSVLACTWASSKLPGRAPEGHTLFRLFLGRTDDETLFDRSDAELLALAREELRRTLGVTAPPLLHRLYRWRRAMPLYVLGHPERIERIEQLRRQWPGLHLAGAAFRGVGIPDSIRDAERAVDHIVMDLTKG